MDQILQGNYFQATKDGYINRGHQTLKFSSKVIHLPVHSKCNELLRSESHPIEISEHERVNEVHCFYKPGHKNKMLKIDKLHLQKLQEIEENQDAVQNINTIKNHKHKDINENQKIKKQKFINQNNPETILSPKFTAANFTPKHIRPQISRQPITFKSQTIIHSGKDDYTPSSLSPPTPVKNPLKQAISLINLQNSPSSKDESDYKIGINTPKTADMKKSLKFKITTQNSQSAQQQQQFETERDKYNIGEPQTTVSQPTPKHRNFHFENKLINQVSALLLKVQQMQHKIKQNTNNMKLMTLQDDIKQADKTLIKLQQQKTLLKNSSNCHCHHHQCHQNNSTNNNLHLFIMFLLGLVIAKAIFVDFYRLYLINLKIYKYHNNNL